MTKEKRPFSSRDRIGYAMGDLGCGLSFSLISTYMLLFYTQYIGLTTQNWAWIIIVSKVWDAVNDILIGNLIDRKRISKKSKFMPWIAIGSVGLVVLTVMIFVPVKSFSQTGKAIWCLVSYCLWSVAYTTVNVPYGSLHSVITEDPRQRTSLSTFRSIGAGVAMILVMALPSIVYDSNNQLIGERVFYVSIIFSVAAFFIFWGMRKLVTERVEYSETAEKVSYFTTVRSFFTNRPMVAATIATVASVVFYNSTMSVNNLVFQYYFGDASKTTLATLAGYIPLVLLMPFTGVIVSKLGKKTYISLAGLISAVASILLVFIPIPPDSKGVVIWVAGLMIANIGNCVFQIIVWAIIADCIELSFKKSAVREESSLYAMYSFFRKLAQGIGSALVALLLGSIGFVEGENAIQPESFCTDVRVLYASLLAVGTVIMFVCMKFIYNIGKKEEQMLGSGEAVQ